MNRTERMFAMVEALRAAGSRGRTSTWLAEHFEISPRTVKRDMQALIAAKIPVVSQDGRGGGYQLARQETLPPLQFTDGEAAAMAVAIAAEPDLPFATDARAALDKILGAMRPDQRRDVDDLASRVWMRTASQPGRPAITFALDEALRRHVAARIEYVDERGNVSERTIEPVVFARTGGRWFALAWCRRRRAGRWFRLDRIRKVHLTRELTRPRDINKTFGPPPPDAHPVQIHRPRGKARKRR